MARPIWRGNISFGLVNIPVQLFTAQKSNEQVHFHLLDKKSHSRIHNQRINEKGTAVPWEDIEKAYEFEKGKYVIVDEKMLEKTAATNFETVEISDFIPFNQIDPFFFEKPYYLIPGGSGLKGYVLLHDILQRTKKAGIAKVVIKTREHMAAIIPIGEILGLILLRYSNQLYTLKDFAELNPLSKAKIKIAARELALAEQLVESMSTKWKPETYHDENRELLLQLIKANIKQGKSVTDKSKHPDQPAKKDKKSEDVLNFMDLLKQSVKNKEKKHRFTPKKPGGGHTRKSA